MLLTELNLQPGSVIHVQDSRLVTGKNGSSPEMTKFVRKDFRESREAHASFLKMTSNDEDDLDSRELSRGVKEETKISETFLKNSVSQIEIIL